MLVKFRQLSVEAVLPSYAKEGDAGLDISTTDNGTHVEVVRRGENQEIYSYWEYGTGLAIEIPPGYVGLLYPRSSISKTGLTLCNSVGVVDSGYRGEIKLRFNKTYGTRYNKGDRIAQLIIVPYPTITPMWSGSLSSTVRGEDGFGSTDEQTVWKT